MKTKNLVLSVLSVFIVAAFLGMASAAIVLNPTTSSQSIAQDGSSSFTFTIGNNAGDGSQYNTFTSVVSDLTGTAGTLASSQVTIGTLPSTVDDGITSSAITVTTNVPLSQAVGTYTGTITIDAEGTVSNPNSQEIAVTIIVSLADRFCSSGSLNATELELSVDISNKGEGDDERWLPLDIIEIEVELDNKNDRIDFDGDGDTSDGDGDLDDVTFELGLFKEGNLDTNLIDDMDWVSKDDEEFEVGNIDEDESDKHTFKFRVDPGEIDDGNYVLMVKAYPKGGETDEACIDSSADLADSDFGTSEFFADIEVELESDSDKMVVVDEGAEPIMVNGFCYSQASLSVDVWNIGDEDFPDKVLVTLVNSELGLDEKVAIDGDFDAGDREKVTFNFAVPEDAEKKTYALSLRTLYDYDEDDDVYDKESDETFKVFLKVEGSCSSFTGSEASVTANLESGGDAGDNLVIKTTITNNGDEQMTYLVSPAGFGVWASSADAVPATFTLAAGQSRDVTSTLSVNDDASGQQSFNVEVIANNELVVSQPVSVEIEGKSGFLTGSAIGSNGYLWGFGLLNLIIIVAIIIVAVRVMRR